MTGADRTAPAWLESELLDSVLHPMIVVDPARTIIYWNGAAEAKYGWTSAEALGRPSVELITREESPEQMRAMVEVLLRGETWSGDYDVRRRDGTTVSVYVTNRPVFDDRGMLTAVIGVSVDASERRRLSSIVEGSGDAIIGVGRDGIVTSWNAAAERLFQYSAEEAIGGPVDVISPADRADEQADAQARVSEGGFAEHEETVRRRKDGSSVDVLLTQSPTTDHEGAVVGFSVIAHDITERRRAEQALEASRRQLADAQRIAHLGSVEFDLTNGTVTRSEEFYRILGVAQGAEPEGGLIPSVLQPSDRPSWMAAWSRATREGAAFDLSYPIVRPDGSERRVRVRGVPEVDDAGRVLKVTGTLLDETQRIKDEDARLRYQRLFLSFLDHLPVGVYIAAADGSPFYANQKAIDLMGPTDASSASVADLAAVYAMVRAGTDDSYPPEDQPVAKALAGVSSHEEDTEIRRPGRAVPLEVWASPVRADDGTVSFGMAVFVDITARRQTEAREQFQARLLERTGQAIIAVDRRGAITYWNRAAEHLYGWTADEAKARPVIAGVLRKVTEAQLAAITASVAADDPWSGELLLSRRDRTTFPAFVTATPLYDDAGEVGGLIGMSTDVTERRALEDRLNQDERLSSLGQLAGGIAHDFNNLLNVITNYADFVAQETTGLIHEDAVEIITAAAAATRLTVQLLAFARRGAVDLRAIDINGVVDDIHGLLAHSIGAQVHLDVRVSDVPKVLGDRGQLEQILVNLSVNARDAMPSGGTLTIETALVELDDNYVERHPDAAAGRYVELSVSDTGGGMPPEVAQRAFEPFFTTKPEGLGTGLGLATIHGIAAQAGGTVHLYSEVGFGTTVRVYLPLADASAELSSSGPDVALMGGHGERVLVVEDHDAVRALTVRILRRNGYVVVESGSPMKAVRIAAEERFDLLLTDVVMPEMSGRALAESVGGTCPDLRVLFMSGYSEGVLGPTRTLAERVTLVQKPFTEAALLAAVRAVLTAAPSGS